MGSLHGYKSLFVGRIIVIVIVIDVVGSRKEEMKLIVAAVSSVVNVEVYL